PLPAANDCPIAEQGIGIAAKRLVQRPTEKFGSETGSIHVKITGNPFARIADQSRNPFAAEFGFDGGVSDFNADITAAIFEPANEGRVLDVKRMVVVEHR